MSDYASFIASKSQLKDGSGFEPIWMPNPLFDFQAHLVDWAIRKGRAALFADCGLGKTLMQLVWAENVVRHTNGRVLILTPLAVTSQTVREAEKFGIECSRQGGRITVTNYERLHYHDPADFVGVVCDESSILKSFDGVRRGEITAFMRKTPYRLLCTATAAPNDYIELGTSSEALGGLGHIDMLNRFFKNDRNTSDAGHRMYGGAVQWRFKGHAEIPFWRWVCSWARAARMPSDLGFEDGNFTLPPLTHAEHVLDAPYTPPGMLFSMPAIGLDEQRAERRGTLRERCERLASLAADTGEPAILWCDLNPEGDLLEKMVPGAIQVSGADHDDAKEEKFLAFASGQARVLVTKPKIGAWGLNFQNCAHVGLFPSHSFEQYYQAIRRCWRFGQSRPVHVDIVATPGQRGVLNNLQRKAGAADAMFSQLVALMADHYAIRDTRSFNNSVDVPKWL